MTLKETKENYSITLRRTSEPDDNASSTIFPTSSSSINSGLAIRTNPKAYIVYNELEFASIVNRKK